MTDIVVVVVETHPHWMAADNWNTGRNSGQNSAAECKSASVVVAVVVVVPDTERQHPATAAGWVAGNAAAVDWIHQTAVVVVADVVAVVDNAAEAGSVPAG